MGLSRKLSVIFFMKHWARRTVRIQEVEVIVAIIIVQKLPRYENSKSFSEAVGHNNPNNHPQIFTDLLFHLCITFCPPL